MTKAFKLGNLNAHIAIFRYILVRPFFYRQRVSAPTHSVFSNQKVVAILDELRLAKLVELYVAFFAGPEQLQICAPAIPLIDLPIPIWSICFYYPLLVVIGSY